MQLPEPAEQRAAPAPYLVVRECFPNKYLILPFILGSCGLTYSHLKSINRRFPKIIMSEDNAIVEATERGGIKLKSRVNHTDKPYLCFILHKQLNDYFTALSDSCRFFLPNPLISLS